MATESAENVVLTFPERSFDLQSSVRTFRVEEAMSSLFSARVQFVSPLSSIDLAALVGSPAAFEVRGNNARCWQGICRKARLVRVSDDREGLTTYEVELVPHLFRLTQRRNNRLFQHASIPEMVTKILSEWLIDYEWRISPLGYPKLELRTQFEETDFTFISRLLEEAGVSFWFVPGEDKQARLILGDAPETNLERPGPPLAFVDDVTLAHAARTEFVTKVQIEEQTMPGRVTLRDHDERRPRMPLYARAESARQVEHSHELYDFEPGSFRAEGAPTDLPAPFGDNLGVSRMRENHGAHRARLKVEALDAQRRMISFESSVPNLSPATTLRIAGHPHDDLSTKTRLLMLRFVLEGEVAKASDWLFFGVATLADKPYRPPMTTLAPRMNGILTAVVVGPQGVPGKPFVPPRAVGAQSDTPLSADATAKSLVDNEIHVDEMGRVRVQFPWDREHDFNDESSIWMRVSQGWAGGGYGMFTIPRVGHEVLVAFVNGDPDSPLVVGRVHNAREPVPFPLPENKTVSTWKSASSPGGKGFNELRFDDAKGREHVFLQSEKDMDQLIKHDLKQAVGNDSSRYVQNDEHIAVGGDKTKFVNQNELETTGLSRETFVGLNRLATVGVEDSTLVGRRWSVTVGRGLTGRLVGELEQAAGTLGNVVRNAATSVLGFVPDNPLAKAADAALAGFGRAAFERIHNALKVLDGFGTDAGPPPTTVEVVDRQIKLSTGEASIILDGPNVTISAQGTIAFHAMRSISVLGEEEVAIGGREKVALVSATDDVIVQAFKDVHLNPFHPGDLPPPAVRLEGEPKGTKPRCELHPDHAMIEDGDGWRCPMDFGGGSDDGEEG